MIRKEAEQEEMNMLMLEITIARLQCELKQKVQDYELKYAIRNFKDYVKTHSLNS